MTPKNAAFKQTFEQDRRFRAKIIAEIKKDGILPVVWKYASNYRWRSRLMKNLHQGTRGHFPLVPILTVEPKTKNPRITKTKKPEGGFKFTVETDGVVFTKKRHVPYP